MKVSAYIYCSIHPRKNASTICGIEPKDRPAKQGGAPQQDPLRVSYKMAINYFLSCTCFEPEQSIIVLLALIYVCGSAFPITVAHAIFRSTCYLKDHQRAVVQNAATRKRTLVTIRSGQHPSAQPFSLNAVYYEIYFQF